MKRISIGLLMLVGCSHSSALPAEPAPVVIEVRRLPPTRIKGETVEEFTPPVKTWLSREEWDQQRLREAIEKAAQEDPCQKGDPLCEHLPPSL